jgi:hypothetical protein
MSDAAANPWRFWQDSLAGAPVKPKADRPEAGFYRVKKGGGWGEPVAIWTNAQGAVLAKRGAEMVDANKVWSWCCSFPVFHSVYLDAVAGKGWPDEATVALERHASEPIDAGERHESEVCDAGEITDVGRDPGIGDNSGTVEWFSPPLDTIIQTREDAKKWLAGIQNVITTQEQADKANSYVQIVARARRDAESAHEVEKAPYLKAGQALDAKLREIKAEAASVETQIVKIVQDYLIAERRRREEAARRANEEAAATRLAERAEAERARRAEMEAEGRAEAEITKAIAAAPPPPADPMPLVEAIPVKAGLRGTGIKLKDVPVVEIVDFEALAKAYAASESGRAAIIAWAEKVGPKSPVPIPGIRITKEAKASK